MHGETFDDVRRWYHPNLTSVLPLEIRITGRLIEQPARCVRDTTLYATALCAPATNEIRVRGDSRRVYKG